MLEVGALAERLRRELPADALVASPAEFSIDGTTPALVASPASQEQVAAVLATASELGSAAVAWGSGAHMALGTPPDRYDIALDLRRLDRLVEHEPADLTVTVEAGIRLVELQRRLGERGQWLPLDPPGSAVATVGGVLAVNASGPARVAHGSARDLLIGITVATATGELVRSGGRVVKNVAGYDMGKLHIGALGTLGVIVQASFKVKPLPQRRETVLVAAGDLGAALALARQAADAGLAVDGLAATNLPLADAPWMLALRLAGVAGAVERSRRELGQHADTPGLALREPDSNADVWERLLDLCRPASPDDVVLRASVKPSEASEITTSLAALGAEVLLYPTLGSIYARWASVAALPESEVSSLRDRCEAAGGALVVEAAPLELKQRLGVWGATRSDFALMRRVKAELDPRGVLSPGRFLGGL